VIDTTVALIVPSPSRAAENRLDRRKLPSTGDRMRIKGDTLIKRSAATATQTVTALLNLQSLTPRESV
jgi:hypothetical protein